MVIFAKKIKQGNTVAVISPATSLARISEEVRSQAILSLQGLGLNVEFGKHAEELTDHINQSSRLESRLHDLHEAFTNERYVAIFTTLGGYNCHQLLGKIDFALIKNHPKVICGYSDITALLNVIYAKTGLVTFYGPHFSTLGMRHGLEYTLEYLHRALFYQDSPIIRVISSPCYRDEPWYLDQENVNLLPNDEGMIVIRTGQAKGTILGGNLCTFTLLFGTPWTPALPPFEEKEVILFLEDDDAVGPVTAPYFQRHLQMILHQERLAFKIAGIVLGRFQRASKMDRQTISAMIDGLVGLPKDIPVVANVDFGHTSPMITIPIGGVCQLMAHKNKMDKDLVELIIGLEH